MDLNIIYLSVKEGTPPHSYWDHGFLDDYLFPQFKHKTYECSKIPDGLDGAVVVIPARAQFDCIEAINVELAKLRWCIVILTGDEESVFPWRELSHIRMLVWIMSPKQSMHGDAAFKIGSGYRKEEPSLLRELGLREREYDWFFAGQVTHEARIKCVEALKNIPNGVLLETKGFGQGLEYGEYIQYMSESKFIPCPSGPVSPDNFRLYEALEAGCIPIADGGDYWSFLFDEPVPFPVLSDWSKLPEILPTLLNNYQPLANKVFGWWQLYKRRIADKLYENVRSCDGQIERIVDDVTIIMPTTHMPSNPSTEVIEQTLDSAVQQMPNSELIVMIDGLKPEKSECLADYEEATRRLLHLLKYKYKHAIPMRFEQYGHQSLMTRQALKIIHTPLILFVEHDTPITRDIDWVGIKEVVKSNYAYVVRLSHEGRVLDEHQYLMLDKEPQLVHGVPLIRTIQWSQRPQLCSTDFYRTIIEKYHDDQPRFIEHVMYGHLAHGDWNEFRVHIYAPEGDMQRSIHLDGKRYGV